MNILIGVCGSISCYKSYELVRLYKKAGHDIKVVLTHGAERFIKKETFIYLGASEVFAPQDDFKAKSAGEITHIQLRNWMDQFIIAPLSANSLSKLAHGFCDDLLSSIFLANTKKLVILFPAMNTQMFENSITQKNIDHLKELSYVFIHPPASGELACGEQGSGKLPEVEDIFHFSQALSLKKGSKNVLITTGATISPLDPVRFLSNPSSGKTGFEITQKYLFQGHNVTLIYGKNSTFPKMALKAHPRLKLIEVSSTQDMLKAVDKYFDECNIYISSAAINDIEFSQASRKIKKSTSVNNLNFNWAPDILSLMLKKRSNQKIISFAAETDELEENFTQKWKRKPVDLLIGNQVNENMGFAQDANHYYFIQNGSVIKDQYLSKKDLATTIYDFTEKPHDNTH